MHYVGHSIADFLNQELSFVRDGISTQGLSKTLIDVRLSVNNEKYPAGRKQ